ncbi:MAG: hypothetical protein Q4F73_11960 [Corynebacterium sp.]|nr:hypothetical protein [Corynebacterium sp.]
MITCAVAVPLLGPVLYGLQALAQMAGLNDVPLTWAPAVLWSVVALVLILRASLTREALRASGRFAGLASAFIVVGTAFFGIQSLDPAGLL